MRQGHNQAHHRQMNVIAIDDCQRWFMSFVQWSMLCLLVVWSMILALPANAAPTQIQLESGKGQIIRLPRPAEYVFIANPDIANVEVRSPTFLYVFGKAVGDTNLYALDAQGREMVSSTVMVTHNLSRLAQTITDIIPEADIEFTSTNGSLVLKGTVASPEEADRISRLAASFIGDDELINMLDIKASNQVMLRVRVAEVARTELKEFGIHLDSLFNAGNFVFGIANGRSFVNDVTGLVTRREGDGNLFMGNRMGNWDVNGVLDALAEEGLVNILAEPSLTAISGKRASFLAGGEFPIPVALEDDRISIEFREFGVRLSFEPTVMSSNRIGLYVQPEVSALSEIGAVELNNFNIPALSTRRAETTVELASGQSFAIAGLLQSQSSNDISKFPGLGDLPVLGALFTSTRFQRSETELVVIVTPYIVRGVPESELATPTDGYTAPTDIERLLFGRLHSAHKTHGDFTNAGVPAVMKDAPKLHGDVGFIIE